MADEVICAALIARLVLGRVAKLALVVLGFADALFWK